MDTIPLFELQKICRICLKTTDLLISIFSPSFLMRPIDMLEKLNIIKFNSDDQLPSSICQQCLYRLLDAFNLQQLSEASESQLRGYLNTKTQQIGATFIENCNISINVNSCGRSFLDQEPTNVISSRDSQCLEKNDGTDDIYDIYNIEVEDDVLNDVEIDVSSLTRSEAEDTIQDIIIINESVELENELNSAASEINQKPGQKKSRKTLKNPDKCEKCGKTFKYSGYLESHLRTHSGEKPFQCKICLRSFAQSSNLLLHKRIHSGERRYQCEICSRFFTTSSNLNSHKTTHLESRDFECTQCSRRFKSQRDLIKHQIIHREVKEAICRICNKAFIKVAYLNIHLRTVHKGIRKHKCPECNKDFANRSNLTCHMRTHTGEKPYHCKYCSSRFTQSSALVRHTKQHLKKITLNADVIKETKHDEGISEQCNLTHNYIATNSGNLLTETTGDLIDFHQNQDLTQYNYNIS